MLKQALSGALALLFVLGLQGGAEAQCVALPGGCPGGPPAPACFGGLPTIGNLGFGVLPAPCPATDFTITIFGLCSPPIPLTFPTICTPGIVCTLDVFPIFAALTAIAPPGPAPPIPLPIPLDPTLIGAMICSQTFCYAAVPACSSTISDVLKITFLP